jgi:hypothetical protein
MFSRKIGEVSCEIAEDWFNFYFIFMFFVNKF